MTRTENIYKLDYSALKTNNLKCFDCSVFIDKCLTQFPEYLKFDNMKKIEEEKKAKNKESNPVFYSHLLMDDKAEIQRVSLTKVQSIVLAKPDFNTDIEYPDEFYSINDECELIRHSKKVYKKKSDKKNKKKDDDEEDDSEATTEDVEEKSDDKKKDKKENKGSEVSKVGKDDKNTVLDISLKNVNSYDSVKVDAKKLEIICSTPRPLEPLFGEKTCN